LSKNQREKINQCNQYQGSLTPLFLIEGCSTPQEEVRHPQIIKLNSNVQKSKQKSYELTIIYSHKG